MKIGLSVTKGKAEVADVRVGIAASNGGNLENDTVTRVEPAGRRIGGTRRRSWLPSNVSIGYLDH